MNSRRQANATTRALGIVSTMLTNEIHHSHLGFSGRGNLPARSMVHSARADGALPSGTERPWKMDGPVPMLGRAIVCLERA
eukprot:7607380-Pyramimonas_sp.AAC.1